VALGWLCYAPRKTLQRKSHRFHRRTPQELDYIVEPDVFHDLFGHVPPLFPTHLEFAQCGLNGEFKAFMGRPCGRRLHRYRFDMRLIL
jgi:phenylalanine-4-hydroxylase